MSIDLTAISETIVVLGGIAAAVLSIIKLFSMFGKPAQKAKEKRKQQLAEEIEEVFNIVAPKYHKEHDKELIEFFDGKGAEMEDHIISAMTREVKLLEEEDQRQNQTISIMSKAIVHSFRQKIVAIYTTYEDVKVLPRYVRDDLDELFADYIANGGNHYIEILYNRMKQWPVDESKTTPGRYED